MTAGIGYSEVGRCDAAATVWTDRSEGLYDSDQFVLHLFFTHPSFTLDRQQGQISTANKFLGRSANQQQGKYQGNNVTLFQRNIVDKSQNLCQKKSAFKFLDKNVVSILSRLQSVFQGKSARLFQGNIVKRYPRRCHEKFIGEFHATFVKKRKKNLGLITYLEEMNKRKF